jgi:DNA-binding NarL/FixJ family response regulator
VAAWRSTAALAHLALGDAASARELASQELEQARAAGVTRVVIRDLRVLGLVERGERGLELLEQAVEAGDRYPPRLEHLRALIDLGAALRRANRRAAAREPLRRALELSHSGGATALDERTRSELAAAGARPRRAMLSGIESLTPSERRVAEVAAKGLTTRQIAETLFVSPKTVEFHLRHIYQKLDIASRSELTKLLEDDGSAG